MDAEWVSGRTDAGIVFESIQSAAVDKRPWIIFTHGVGLRRQIWRPWGKQLATDYNLLAFDVPGYGESDLDSALPRDLDSWSSYIGRVQDYLAVENSVLVGESLGGTASLKYAIENPRRVSSLILCSTGFRGSLIPEVNLWRGIFEHEGVDGWSDYMNERRFAPDDPQSAVEEATTAQSGCRPDIVTSDGEMLLGVDLGQAMESLTTAVLLIQPGSSPFISREHAYLCEEAIPNSSLCLIGASRHGIALAYADECALLTRHFLSRHLPPSTRRTQA